LAGGGRCGFAHTLPLACVADAASLRSSLAYRLYAQNVRFDLTRRRNG
jgi:hypothetical protein